MLAGIGTLTVVDPAPLTDADLGAQFLVPAASLGTSRASAAAVSLRRLNPRVRVVVDDDSPQAPPVTSRPPSFFAQFTAVIATDLAAPDFRRLSTLTREAGIPLYCAGTHGVFGFAFADLIDHSFQLRRAPGNVATRIGPETATRDVLAVQTTGDGRSGSEPPVEIVTKRERYSGWTDAAINGVFPSGWRSVSRRLRNVSPVLPCLRGLWAWQEEHEQQAQSSNATSSSSMGGGPRGAPVPSLAVPADLASFTRHATAQSMSLGLPPELLRPEHVRRFLQNCGSEISPATAVLGGQLAQDLIAVLGRNQPPLQNLLVFDGDAMDALVYTLHPEDGPTTTKTTTPAATAASGSAAAAKEADSGGKNGGSWTDSQAEVIEL